MTNKTYFPIFIALFTGVGFFTGNFFKTTQNDTSTISIKSEQDTVYIEDRFNEIVRYIDAKYYKEIDHNNLVDNAIKKVVKELDPFSYYLTQQEVRLSNAELQGEYGGIGINTYFIDDTLFISKVADGATFTDGSLKPKDPIIRVDSVDIVGMDWDSIRALLIGEVGTTVDLTSIQDDQEQIVRAQRIQITSESVPTAFMVDSTTGYLKVDAFNANTYPQFVDSLERLHQNGAVNLVLDLRNNPGGYLSQAVKMVNQLIDEKEKLLVYTQGDQNKRNNYYSTGRVFFPLKNICILVNENTASAAEVVAGAFQDHDRGFLIGQPTYGKGLVQNQFRMNDGAGLKLTVAKYYTPSGRCIQRSFDTENDPVDTSFYFTSGGREVNGSGGITPDFIIKEPMREQLGDRFQVIKNEAQYFVVLRYFNKIDDTNIFNYLKKVFPETTFSSSERKFIEDQMKVKNLELSGKTKEKEKFLLEADPSYKKAMELIQKEASPLAELN